MKLREIERPFRRGEELRLVFVAALFAAIQTTGQTVKAQSHNSMEAKVPSGAALISPQLTSNAQTRTLLADENLLLNLSGIENAQSQRFAVMVGHEDLTAQFRWVSETQLEGVFAAMPLPLGKSVVKLMLQADGKWSEAGQTEIMVVSASSQSNSINATNSGAASAQSTGENSPNNTQNNPQNEQNQPPSPFKPSLIIGIKSQVYEAHSATGIAPPRERFADLTHQASFQAEQGDEKNSLKAQINVVGSSYRSEEVNFAVLANNAPKSDVANYLVESKFTSPLGTTGLNAGHIQFGQNPLLANSISNRGASLTHQFHPRLDMGLAVQYGTPIVGGYYMLPVTNSEHRMQTAMLGTELFSRAGALRAEITAFSGIAKPTNSIGWATLQDAEQSQGTGLRIKSASESGRLRGDLSYAVSRHTPKGDSANNIAAGPQVRSNAWVFDGAYDAVKDYELAKGWALSLGLTARHEFAGLGYKSLGAGQMGNLMSDFLGFNANIGAISSQLQLSQRSDNVNSDANFLKNRNTALNWTNNIPLGQIINSEKPPAWAPQITLSLGRNNTQADKKFIPLGQTLANLPDVRVSTLGSNFNWRIDKLNFGVQLNRTAQDNQQVGMEQMDTTELAQNLTLAYAFSEKINLSGAFGKRHGKALDTGVERFGQTAQQSIAWQFGNRYTLNTNFNWSHDRDSLLTTDMRSLQGQLQLIKQFDFTALGLKLPGQWTLTYSMNNNQSMGVVVRYQTVNFALNLTFF